jgi:hypothetical protein
MASEECVLHGLCVKAGECLFSKQKVGATACVIHYADDVYYITKAKVIAFMLGEKAIVQDSDMPL